MRYLKYVTFVVVALLSFAIGSAQEATGIRFFKGSFAEAQAEAPRQTTLRGFLCHVVRPL